MRSEAAIATHVFACKGHIETVDEVGRILERTVNLAMIGPTRPGDAQGGRSPDAIEAATSSDDEEIGPLPPTSEVLSADPSVTEAAQVFREREARIAEAKSVSSPSGR